MIPQLVACLMALEKASDQHQGWVLTSEVTSQRNARELLLSLVDRKMAVGRKENRPRSNGYRSEVMQAQWVWRITDFGREIANWERENAKASTD